MIRVALALLVLSLATLPVMAQFQTLISQIKPLLQSKALSDQAWGAWLVAASRDVAFRGPLTEQLRQAKAFRYAQRGTDERVVQTLLDALIQLSGPVPGEVLSPSNRPGSMKF